MNKTFAAIKQAALLLRHHPSVALPFVMLAAVEGVVLYLLFLAPQQPFATLLAPPIERFWGEQYVHYPWHLVKLPELFIPCKILLSFLPGMFLNAVFVGLIADVKTGNSTTFWKHFSTSVQRFFAILVIWGFNLGAIKLFEMPSHRLVMWAEAHDWLLPAQLLAHFASFWVQIIWLYTIPLVMLCNASLFRALCKNFSYLKRLFLPTSICLLIAALFYLIPFFLGQNMDSLVNRYGPEVIVVFLSLGIFMNLVVNLWVTATSTLLMLQDESTTLSIYDRTGKASA